MTPGPVLETPDLVLHEMSAKEAAGPYLDWVHDPEVMRFLVSRERRYTADELAAYIDAENANPAVLFLGIFLRSDGEHIGTIKLIRKEGEGDWLGVLIGCKAQWGKGHASAAIKAVVEHAFTVLGLDSLQAACFEPNIGSQRAFERAGFAVVERRLTACPFPPDQVIEVRMRVDRIGWTASGR